MSDVTVGRVEFGPDGDAEKIAERVRLAAARAGMTPAEWARVFNSLTPTDILLANKDHRIAELEAEVAELRRDKARMDWLQRGLCDIEIGECGVVISWKGSWCPPQEWNEGDVRAAIDAAMERKA